MIRELMEKSRSYRRFRQEVRIERRELEELSSRRVRHTGPRRTGVSHSAPRATAVA